MYYHFDTYLLLYEMPARILAEAISRRNVKFTGGPNSMYIRTYVMTSYYFFFEMETIIGHVIIRKSANFAGFTKTDIILCLFQILSKMLINFLVSTINFRFHTLKISNLENNF